jgi:lipoprotein-anchoring transpeptidase ErfK/SrfK
LTLALLAGTSATPVAAQRLAAEAQSTVRPSAASGRQRGLQRAVSARRASSAAEREAAKATASGPLIVVASLASQRMTVYDSTGPIMRAPISTGKAGHRTPTGVFSVIQKNRHHVSNIYSGAPMPYMQRITWSGIALHAGVLPGYPASAGCIRMPYPVSARLFAMSKMGMRVIVAPTEPAAVAFSHRALPEPVMVAAPAFGPADRQADNGGEVRVAATEGAGVATRFLNPVQHAQAERVRAKAHLAEVIRQNQHLLDASRQASAEANAAKAAIETAEAAVEAADYEARGVSYTERSPFEARVREAERLLEQARRTEAEKNRVAFAAAVVSREAEERIAEAEAAARIAERGTEPIAVLISRREGKVMVRQGMVPLFEAPVDFKDPDRPLGTHVFQAMTADSATGRIGWIAITVPEGEAQGAAGARSQEAFENRGPVRRERGATPSAGLPSDARNALDRVIVAPEVMRRIAERLWINGSIVVSDHGLGRETGKGTDFIVETR